MAKTVSRVQMRLQVILDFKPLQFRFDYSRFLAWVIPALSFLPAYFSGQNLSNYTSLTQTPLNTSFAQTLTPGSGVSEDCLFLDVIVPEKVFNAAKSNRSSGYNEARCAPGEPCKVPSGAPVLVWIYGGGYTAGSKTSEGSPASLVARSVENDGEGIVYVAMNYRLGLFVSSLIRLPSFLTNMHRAGYLVLMLLRMSGYKIKDWHLSGFSEIFTYLVVMHRV